MIKPFFSVRHTPFGSVVVVWVEHGGQAKIRRVFLPGGENDAQQLTAASYPYARQLSCSEIDFAGDQMESFFAGNDIRFSLDMVQLELCSEFQQKVLRAEHGIPRGCVSTYQRIAKNVGRAKGARAVGMALANNPFPIIIPCHRVIRSDETLGGYQGGADMKRILLEMEGVDCGENGCITTGAFFY